MKVEVMCSLLVVYALQFLSKERMLQCILRLCIHHWYLYVIGLEVKNPIRVDRTVSGVRIMDELYIL